MNDLGKVLSRKGLFEVLYLCVSMSLNKFWSIWQIILLRWRGYNIHFSVRLRGSATFSQSHKGHMYIGEGTVLGRNIRLDAGFGGRIHIGKDVLIDDGSFITAQKNIQIGDDCLIAAGVFITDFNHDFSDPKKLIRNQGYNHREVVIGRDVWIGAHACILSGVHIGEGSIVGAGSVVTKDVAPYTVVAGDPAKYLKPRT